MSQQYLPHFLIEPRKFDWLDYTFDDGMLGYLRNCDKFAYADSSDSSDSSSSVDEGETEKLIYPSYLDGLSSADKSMVMKNYEELEESFRREKKVHPERSARYTLSAVVHKQKVSIKKAKLRARLHNRYSDREREQEYDFHMLKLIQQLSNLSTSLRQDLGTVIWKKTKLHISGNTALSCGPPAFFMDRPSIVQGIRCLSLDVPVHELRESNETFNMICRYLSRHSKIAHLQVNLFADFYVSEDSVMDTLCKGNGRFAGLQLVRLIPVSVSFEVSFQNESTIDDYTWKEQLLRDEYLGRLRDLLLPNTLRIVPNNTAKKSEMQALR
jgi:hypothetical protein